MRTLKQASLFVWIILLSLISGCSSSVGTGIPVLHIYVPGTDYSAFHVLASRCNSAHDHQYHLTMMRLPRSADEQRLQLARRLTAHDHHLDLVSLDVMWTAEFAHAGWIRPLEDDPSGMALDDVRHDILAGPLQTAMWDRHLYAAPIFSDTQLLWYRRDLVTQPPASWQEMLANAHQLYQQHLPSWIGVQAKQYEGVVVWFNTLLESAGGHVLSDDGQTVTLVDTPAHRNATIQALTIMHQVATIPGHDPSLTQSDEASARLAFEHGKSAFELNWPFVLPSLLSNAIKGAVAFLPLNAVVGLEKSFNTNGIFTPTEDQFLQAYQRAAQVVGIGPYPGVISGREAKVTLGGLNLAVSTTSAHPREAFDALRCLRSADNQKYLAIYAGLPPVRQSVYQDGEVHAWYPQYALLRRQLDHAALRPVTPYYQAMSTRLAAMLVPVDRIDPARMADQLAEQVHNAITGQGLIP